MSDLAQWIAYQRRAAVFGTSEETVLALLDVLEQADALTDNEGCSCYRHGGPCPRCKIAYDDTRAALARLVEVKHG